MIVCLSWGSRLHFHRLIEMILLIPGLIFGRHLFPYVIISSFIFFGQQFGFHLTISRHNLYLMNWVSTSLFTVLVTEGLKHVINRDRPSLYDTTNKLVQMRKYMSNPAFPSGDSAQVYVHSSFQWNRRQYSQACYSLMVMQIFSSSWSPSQPCSPECIMAFIGWETLSQDCLLAYCSLLSLFHCLIPSSFRSFIFTCFKNNNSCVFHKQNNSLKITTI